MQIESHRYKHNANALIFFFFLPSFLKALEIAKAEKRVRFTSAVFHHLSAIKIQRAVRAHWALENAKRQIHSVVTIQVVTS